MDMRIKNGWTKSMIADAIEARLGVRLPKSSIILAGAKELENEQNYARHNYIGGVLPIGGFGGVPDAIVFAEREPFEDAPVFINQIMFRANRVSTLLIDEIADAIF